LTQAKRNIAEIRKNAKAAHQQQNRKIQLFQPLPFAYQQAKRIRLVKRMVDGREAGRS
jgi:hypothetical protein